MHREAGSVAHLIEDESLITASQLFYRMNLFVMAGENLTRTGIPGALLVLG